MQNEQSLAHSEASNKPKVLRGVHFCLADVENVCALNLNSVVERTWPGTAD